MTTQQQAFINIVGPLAINNWNATHIVVPSIVMAQAILESGWGKSELTVNANNMFGIKADVNWKGASYTTLTTEYYKGVKTKKMAAFRKYANWQESINDHVVFLSKSRYSNLRGVTDYRKVAQLLSQDGYATDPNYPNKLINIIETYKLNQYDSKENAAQNTTAASNVYYAVQVGAYSLQRNAATMQRHLVDDGYKGYIVTSSDGKIFRVQVGSYTVKANADRTVTDLKAKGYNPIIVQKTK